MFVLNPKKTDDTFLSASLTSLSARSSTILDTLTDSSDNSMQLRSVGSKSKWRFRGWGVWYQKIGFAQPTAKVNSKSKEMRNGFS